MPRDRPAVAQSLCRLSHPNSISCGTEFILRLPTCNRNVQTGCRPHPAPVQRVPGPFPGVRWPGRKRGHLSTSDAEVKNDWSLPLLHYMSSWRGQEELCLFYQLDTTYEELIVGSVPLTLVCKLLVNVTLVCCCRFPMLVHVVASSSSHVLAVCIL